MTRVKRLARALAREARQPADPSLTVAEQWQQLTRDTFAAAGIPQLVSRCRQTGSLDGSPVP